MAIDNSPRERQAAQLARKKASRASYDRILIVTQGTETEPLYFQQIRKKFKLQTTNISIQSQAITSIQLVEYAEQLFLQGCPHRNIKAKSFEKIFVVFDKDDDLSYANAVAKSFSLDKKYTNDLKQKTAFSPIPSVPCFELWFLLHFQTVTAPIHRHDVYTALKKHIPNYEKSNNSMFAVTEQDLNIATENAVRLKASSNNFNGIDSYTLVHELVDLLVNLKNK